jgi:hypothetical protein
MECSGLHSKAEVHPGHKLTGSKEEEEEEEEVVVVLLSHLILRTGYTYLTSGFCIVFLNHCAYNCVCNNPARLTEMLTFYIVLVFTGRNF